MKRLIISLVVCAFLLAPLPAMAQSASEAPAKAQEADMPREVRILVQRGLAALGFDPGPADGLFGRKTRAAIWNWQAAKGLDTTGYLTTVEAQALAAVGAEASKKSKIEGEPGKRRQSGRETRTAPPPSRRRNRILYTPSCAAEKEPGGCWRELSSPANCDVWLARYSGPKSVFAMGETVTWSGECARKRSVLDGLAHGRGTLKAGDWSLTGEYVDGKRHGRWVNRNSDGRVFEGPYMEGKRHGRWVFRYPGGGVREGTYVDGRRHGRWVLRLSNGTRLEIPFVNGKIHGLQVTRRPNGTVTEDPYVDGKMHGRSVTRFPDGTSLVLEWRNGEIVTP